VWEFDEKSFFSKELRAYRLSSMPTFQAKSGAGKLEKKEIAADIAQFRFKSTFSRERGHLGTVPQSSLNRYRPISHEPDDNRLLTEDFDQP
jgi:hypothetical protein